MSIRKDAILMERIELVGQSPAIDQVQRLIKKVAKTNASVMILGESGTGKELIARIVHQNSERSQAPFIPVNCAAIPMELFESELFGHEKGSFTGAHQMRKGKFELAEGGTLFLDEIGDMPASMQVKLLRVLQEKTYERVGGSQALKADVRVIAATHKNLNVCIQQGEFREDLYYRLNVFPISMPSLRERKEDIPILIRHFIEQFKQNNEQPVILSVEAMEFLCQYEWPGNVRELANLIERMNILFAGKVLELADLSQQFFHSMPGSRRQDKDLTILSAKELPEAGFDLKDHLAKLEYTYITQALSEYRGIVSQAAKRLGLRRTTLVEKMRKYGMGREQAS
jgi:sigma-54 specific flagellar transcriptional regulator A